MSIPEAAHRLAAALRESTRVAANREKQKSVSGPRGMGLESKVCVMSVPHKVSPERAPDHAMRRRQGHVPHRSRYHCMRLAVDAQVRRVMESVEVSGLPAEVKPKGTHMNTEVQTRTLEIGGMSGDACVEKVTGALKDVNGVETHSVKVGSANIKSDKAGCEAACAGIKHAGFTAHEATRTGNDRNVASGDPKGDRRGDQQGSQPAIQPVSQHGNEHGKGQSQHAASQPAASQPAASQPAVSQHAASQPGGSTDADKAGKPAGHEPSKAQPPATAPKPVMK